MDFKINESNLDQWCFDYLENQLTPEDKKFFEQALEFDDKIQKEFSNWEQTYLKDLSQIPVSPELTRRTLESLPKLKAGFKLLFTGASIATICILGTLFITKETKTNKEDDKAIIEKVIQKTDSNVSITPDLKENTSHKTAKKESAKVIEPKPIISKEKPYAQKDTEEVVFKEAKTQTPPIKKDSVIKNAPYIIETKDLKIPEANQTKKEKNKRSKAIIPTNDKL
jgi:hypothetical protein